MNAELEKWLDEHEYQPDHFLGTVVRLQDLRALFDGKVLVPVEPQDTGAIAQRVFREGTLRNGTNYFSVVFCGDKLIPTSMVIDELNSIDVLVNKLRRANKKIKTMLAASQEQGK
jgi:hypothetical protein